MFNSLQEASDNYKHIHHTNISKLDTFKVQKSINPNITIDDSVTSSTDNDACRESENDNNNNNEYIISPKTGTKRKKIKIKHSELSTIHDYVKEHRHKMKEKTYKYEEKKKQLKFAKERLFKAKQRFKKRLKLNRYIIRLIT